MLYRIGYIICVHIYIYIHRERDIHMYWKGPGRAWTWSKAGGQAHLKLRGRSRATGQTPKIKEEHLRYNIIRFWTGWTAQSHVVRIQTINLGCWWLWARSPRASRQIESPTRCRSETDSERVPWGKGKKDFEKTSNDTFASPWSQQSRTWGVACLHLQRPQP